MRFTVSLSQLRKVVTDVNITDAVQHYAQFIPQAMSLDKFVCFERLREKKVAMILRKLCVIKRRTECHYHYPLAVVRLICYKACPKTSFMFLRKELPVRLANIMSEFNSLPTPLKQVDSVKLVRGWYEETFVDLLEFESLESSQVTDTHLLRFAEQLDIIRNRHSRVVETMAEGIKEFKEQSRYDSFMDSIIQYFLDRFYMNRISIRTLIHQHILLFHPLSSKNKNQNAAIVGGIDQETDVLAIAEDAYDNARFLCEQYYMASPDCQFKSLNILAENQDELITMTYIPTHLYHILFELFKNALRAVVEFHQDSDTIPPIDVMICKGGDDVTIKMSDQGGGIPRDRTELLFNYMYSTAPRPPNPQAASTTPLAGYGYGLPLSRLYAKYMRGSLWLSSVEGYGTDAFVYLKVDPKEASENLPLYNKTSHNKYSQSVPVGDWSDSTVRTCPQDSHINNVNGASLSKRSYCTRANGPPRTTYRS
ncbi:hypothetical protein LSH36_141g10067 [Paralvinella palmiformis]|uniref:Protein-serine/threonine kinase n=1 Tax=Paralvinella palmiformis TaxID=53620 RepID=A0AAD9JWE4_9ANNE|nr:hypothetical protein LSH36_141g10067 [Paralvinella palmiformis]